MAIKGDTSKMNPEDKELWNRWNDLRKAQREFNPMLRNEELDLVEVFYQIKPTIEALLYVKAKEIIKEVEKIVYVDRPTKLSPEVLEYKREYYKLKKEQEAQQDKKKQRQERINLALVKRKRTFCYTCKKSVELLEPKIVLKDSRNFNEKKIIVESVCPICNSICRGFGGYISEE